MDWDVQYSQRSFDFLTTPWRDEEAPDEWSDTEPLSEERCMLCGIVGHLRLSVGGDVNLYMTELCGACGGERIVPRLVLPPSERPPTTCVIQRLNIRRGALWRSAPSLQGGIFARLYYDEKTRRAEATRIRTGGLAQYCALRDTIRRAPNAAELAKFSAPHDLAPSRMRKGWGPHALRQLRLAAGAPFPSHGIYGTYHDRFEDPKRRTL